MTSAIDSPRRIAFVVGAKTGEELAAGNNDVARVFWIFANPKYGDCSNSPKPLHECPSK